MNRITIVTIPAYFKVLEPLRESDKMHVFVDYEQHEQVFYLLE